MHNKSFQLNTYTQILTTTSDREQGNPIIMTLKCINCFFSPSFFIFAEENCYEEGKAPLFQATLNFY
jgi:hypothetical protein